MPKVLFVHGIGQARKSADLLQDELIGDLNYGLKGLHFPLPTQDFVCAFYADLFRTTGTKGFLDPPYDARDLSDFEAEFLEELWYEASRTDTAVVGPQEAVKVRTPRSIQLALNALSRSAFFAGMAERALIGDLKQVSAYMGQLRRQIQDRVREAITPETQVVIGHSLGSVVAYETLAQVQPPDVRVLITLGSPLGIRHLIFDRLTPLPADGRGAWPGPVRHWTNVADVGDVVALTKRLSGLFGDRVKDHLVYNGSNAHDASPYLRAAETGKAIALGLISD
jgi:hypothetical protein